MKIIISTIFIIAFAIIITYTGCKDSVTAADIDKVVIPDSNVSYAKYIQPVFNVKCNSTSCHADASQSGGIVLTTCTNATADPSVIFPGEPDNSRLVWSIEGIGNFPMPPPGYPILTQNQIKGIKTWIKEGAQCN